LQLIDIFKTRTRHPLRPRSSDIIKNIFADFRYYEKTGDSLIMGEGHFDDHLFYVVAQQKPKPEQFSTKEGASKLNWGMLNADEHAQILRLLRRLHEQGPHEESVLLSMVDTYGADISMYSAQRFQAFFIGHLIRAYSTVPIRTISIVLGEGGSGGALAVQVADRRAAVEDALYATAPPESMAAIIFRDSKRIEDALQISRSSAKDLRHFGVIDTIIPAADKIQDAASLSRNIAAYLERASRDLFKRSIKKLLAQRGERAREMGIMRRGRFYDLKRFVERPFRAKSTPPPNIKLVYDDATYNFSGAEDYQGLPLQRQEPHVRCGYVEDKNGCGALIPLEEFLNNHQVCPQCGLHHAMNATGWIKLLTDRNSFHELFRNMSVEDLMDGSDLHDFYRDFLQRQKDRTDFNESLVTAYATIYGYPAIMAICDFAFAGGSMGVVFGEKFCLAIDHALRRGLPVVSVCCSGGARLYEGIVALMQMVKTVAAVQKLKEAGLPFISILGDPSTGGAIASYAALGDVCLSEPDALVIFTGPRVMKSRGFAVDEELVRAQALHRVSAETLDNPEYYGEIRGIQEVVPRSQMKRTLVKYLEMFSRTRGSHNRGQRWRPYNRRIRNIYSD
jgi:acetyl-CoA carboxylase carboxyl transferase beta subunit